MFRNVENLTDPIINSSAGSGVQDSVVVPVDQTSPVGGPTGPRSGTQSIERAVALLECVGASERSLGLSEIARAVGLTPSTTHRLLRALVVAGYVEQEPTTEQYRLGLGIAVLGQRALEHAGYHVAKPVLDDLSARTGESVSLGIRRGDEVVVIEQAASASPLRFDHPAGTELAMHASAMGKVLLANSARSIEGEIALLAKFDRFTERTITAPDDVVAELTAIQAPAAIDKAPATATVSPATRTASEFPNAAKKPLTAPRISTRPSFSPRKISRTRAGLSDCAQVLDQLLARHADAVVLDG